MNISIEKKILSEAVSTVMRFSERKTTTLPTLAGIAIVAEKDSIRFRATNLETGIELFVDGSVKTPGTCALPAGILREVTSSFSGNGSVTIDQDGDTTRIKADGAGSTLKNLPYEDFPNVSLPESGKTSFTMPGATLRALIGSTAPYASSSTVRPELASVLFSAEGGMAKMVATDSFRLAEKKVSVGGSVKPFTLLIPAKNAADIAQTIPDKDIGVRADEHQCAFVWEKGTVVTRLTAANYPDYAAIIPKKFGVEATVLRKDLEGALKRAAIFSDQFQKVRLAFDAGKKEVRLSARNNDVGESAEALKASVSGEALELSFNHRYLAAPLPALTQESITLQAAGIGRPLVIRGQGDQSFLYLVMPMNQ